jgi:hypothetical protein
MHAEEGCALGFEADEIELEIEEDPVVGGYILETGSTDRVTSAAPSQRER